MCGIAGILRVSGPGAAARPEDSIPEAWLDLLDESIKHRGPDGRGRLRDRVVRADGCTLDVAFVHRRLSILDHAGGHQPMLSERGSRGEGTLGVVFNGCIYNHRDLRRELSAKGHRFHTDHSDTEVLLHGWREWGRELLARLDGMFALALWDREAGTMVLARDRMGEKPLYATEVPVDGGWIGVFASVPTPSSLKASLRDLQTTTVLTDGSIVEWIRLGWSSSPPLAGASQVAPGQSVVYGGVRAIAGSPEAAGPMLVAAPPVIAAYGTTRPRARAGPGRALTPEAVDELLREAVRSRLDADVPLGCFLSGGVDSSLVSWYAKEALGDVSTFTVRMPHAGYDESAHAEAAAGVIGSRHATLDCGANPAEDLVGLIERLGLPFGDSSLLPTYWVCRAAREHVRVALSGDGGDELFMGYERHRAAAWLKTGVPFAGAMGRALLRTPDARSTRARLGRFADAVGNLGYWDVLSIFPDSMLRRLVDDPELLGSQAARLAAGTPRDAREAANVDLVHYLPDDLLRKTDAASMHVALEVRCPFLHPSVVDATQEATTESLMPAGQRKGLLRAVARRYFPSSIVDRPKQGFAIPIGEWFRTDFGGLRALLMDTLASADPFPARVLGVELRRGFIDGLVREHMDDRRDHGQRLYMLLVLALWARNQK